MYKPIKELMQDKEYRDKLTEVMQEIQPLLRSMTEDDKRVVLDRISKGNCQIPNQ